MKITASYKASLKGDAVEELLDLLIHRPLAYALVSVIRPLPISANQVSGFSILISLIAAFCIASGSTTAVTVAGVFILLGNILDCADGQLARLRGTTSDQGRIIDGAADYISLISIYAAIGLWHPSGEQLQWYWPVFSAAAMLSFGMQSLLVDFYRNEFSWRLAGRANSAQRELERVIHRLAGSRGIMTFVLNRYAGYLRLQLRLQKEPERLEQVSSSRYVEANSTLIRLWCLNGSATTRFLMAIACFLDRIDLVVLYVLVAGTLWSMLLFIIQRKVDRNLLRRMA